MLGIPNVLDYSMRQLVLMVEGKRKEEWSHTSQLLTLLHNCHSSKPLQSVDFNPCRIKVPVLTAAKVQGVKNIWLANT